MVFNLSNGCKTIECISNKLVKQIFDIFTVFNIASLSSISYN